MCCKADSWLEFALFPPGAGWVETEVWRVSVRAGDLSKRVSWPEHRPLQTEELLRGGSGSSGDSQEGEQEPPRCLSSELTSQIPCCEDGIEWIIGFTLTFHKILTSNLLLPQRRSLTCQIKSAREQKPFTSWRKWRKVWTWRKVRFKLPWRKLK